VLAVDADPRGRLDHVGIAFGRDLPSELNPSFRKVSVSMMPSPFESETERISAASPATGPTRTG